MRASHPRDHLLTCQWPPDPVGCPTWAGGCRLAVKACRRVCHHKECPAVLACRNKEDQLTACTDRARECLVPEVLECRNKECPLQAHPSRDLDPVSSLTHHPSLGLASLSLKIRIPSACHNNSSSRDLECPGWGDTGQLLVRCLGCLQALEDLG